MSGLAATYINETTLTVSGDQTANFVVGRRVRCQIGEDGAAFSAVDSSSHSGGTTTVVLTDAVLTEELVQVWYGKIAAGPTGAQPLHNHSDRDTGGKLPRLARLEAVEDLEGVSGTVEVDGNNGATQTLIVDTGGVTIEFDNIDGIGVKTRIDNTADEAVALDLTVGTDRVIGELPEDAGVFFVHVSQAVDGVLDVAISDLFEEVE